MALSRFQKWYKKNGKEFNVRRKARYHSDPKYRKRHLASLKRWRRANPRQYVPKPKTTFTVGEAAEQIGCFLKTLQMLEKRGLIPSVTDGKAHRQYTQKQIELLRSLIVYRQNNHYTVEDYRATTERLSKFIFKNWKK